MVLKGYVVFKMAWIRVASEDVVCAIVENNIQQFQIFESAY